MQQDILLLKMEPLHPGSISMVRHHKSHDSRVHQPHDSQIQTPWTARNRCTAGIDHFAIMQNVGESQFFRRKDGREICRPRCANWCVEFRENGTVKAPKHAAAHSMALQTGNSLSVNYLRLSRQHCLDAGRAIRMM